MTAKTIFFRVDEDLHNAISAAADREDRPLSYLFIKSMKMWLAQPAPTPVMAPSLTPPAPIAPEQASAPHPPAPLHELTDPERLLDLIDATLATKRRYDLTDGRRAVGRKIMLNAWIDFRAKDIDRKSAAGTYYRALAALKDKKRINHDETLIWRVTA